MKIVQIVHGFPPESVGGTQAYCEAVARALVSRGHTCFILAGTQETRQAPELVTTDQEGLKVTRFIGTLQDPSHWSPSRRAEAERLILKYLDEIRPDVVHVQHWVRLTSNIVAICKSRRIPTVVTLHDLWAACPRGNRLHRDRVFCTDPIPSAPCVSCVVRKEGETDEEIASELGIRQRLIAEELRLADRVLVPSEAQRILLMDLLEIEGVRLHVLAHGTITCLTPAALSDDAAAPLRVAYWGPLTWWKGPHLLLEALHRLPDPGRVEVHLFGRSDDPDYERQLRELAGGLAVIFHGYYSPVDLPRERLHLAVFPSLCHESHSFVLDEAFQLGIPAIVSDRGAPALRIGTAGLTFKTGDVEDLSRQIRNVLEEPELLERLRQGAPVLPAPSMDVHTAQLEGVYRQVIASAHGSVVRSKADSLKVSIVIRSKDEAQHIGEVLQRIFAQVYEEPFEVLLLDSGSRDDTLKIASGFPVTVYPIQPEEFTYGRALNVGAHIAKGDYVIYLSAHCTPVDQEWLARLLQPLEEDPDVVATYGKQEPRRGVNPFEEMELEWLFPPDPSCGPSAIFSAANCAIRRETLLRFPFDEDIPGAEDYLWTRLLPAAYRVVYVPEASVYHSHPLSIRFWANRFYRHGQRFPMMLFSHGIEFGGNQRSPIRSYLKWSLGVAFQEYRYCREKGYLSYLPLIPLHGAMRVFAYSIGLRKGLALSRRP
jgi:glycosyltransferase involved in cell wall biosynthesis